MEQAIFDRMIDEIYSAFGRTRPAYGSAAYRSIFRRVVEERKVPDAAAKPIAYAIGEFDSLPINLGKAILAEFSTWLSAHPELRARAHCCPDCAPDIAGFFWVWDEKGHRMISKCACNHEDQFQHFQSWTRQAALRAGLLLCDPLAPMAALPNANSRSEKAEKVLRSVGNQEKERPAHTAQREYHDAGNW